MNGLLILDKPPGLTSHDLVARARRLFEERRIGHTGTLDPFATGVMVLLIGQATRLAQFLDGAEKEYEAVIRFGYSTDTGDSTGTKLPADKMPASNEFAAGWEESTLDQAMGSLRGDIEQMPPMYSAKKIKGKKLYEYARKGETVERASVLITVHKFEPAMKEGKIVSHNTDGTCDVSSLVVCSAGTYVRVLAESLGERLGVPAHLSALRRTRAGDFRIGDAHTITELDQLGSVSERGKFLLSMTSVLTEMQVVRLTDEEEARTRHGAAVQSSIEMSDGDNIQMVDSAGELVAIGRYDGANKTLRPQIVFV